MSDIDARIERLLNQLEMPGLGDAEIQRIKDRIEYLRTLKQD